MAAAAATAGRLRKQSKHADASHTTANGAGKKTAPSSSAAAAAFSYLDFRAIKTLLTRHPTLVLFFLSVSSFIGVEYTLTMVSPDAPPYDVGFVLTAPLHRGLAARPALNSILAALNTVFVAMQALYIFWALLARGRSRPTVAALFMFTCRGILGYTTQLPLPTEFLGSAMDFPVANVSFFLFFSGHVAGALIASIDMRRAGNHAFANGFDALNALQALRLLATRGHYTIDLAVGVGAGMLFDSMAATYEINAKTTTATAVGAANTEEEYSNGHHAAANGITENGSTIPH